MRCGMVNEVFRKPTSWNWKGDKKRGLGKNRFAIGLEVAYVAVLIIFTMYILLDTFVLSEKITVVDNAQTTSTGKDTTGGTAKSSTGSGSSSSDTDSTGDVSTTSTTYEDDNIKITLTDYRENNTDIHVADVTVSSAEYLKTAFAQSSYGKNVTVRQQCILTVRL